MQQDKGAQRLKPIETTYNGYRFRSRLEARWAVFFDTLGVPYEYEKEGFDLGEAGWYLPDFYLPHEDLWVEIKPVGAIAHEAAQKILTFTKHTKVMLLVKGLQKDGEIGCMTLITYDSRLDYSMASVLAGICYTVHKQLALIMPSCETIDHKPRLFIPAGNFSGEVSTEEANSIVKSGQHAYAAARQARFERR